MDVPSDRLDRRRMIQLGGSGVVVALAGCLEENEDRPGETDHTPGDPDPENANPDDEVEDAAARVAAGADDGYTFDPRTVEVDPGETVEWEWVTDGHTVTPESIPDEATWEGEQSPLEEGDTHRHTFEVEGEYHYICEPHFEEGMEGRVHVGDVEDNVAEEGGDPESGAAGEEDTEADGDDPPENRTDDEE